MGRQWSVAYGHLRARPIALAALFSRFALGFTVRQQILRQLYGDIARAFERLPCPRRLYRIAPPVALLGAVLPTIDFFPAPSFEAPWFLPIFSLFCSLPG